MCVTQKFYILIHVKHSRLASKEAENGYEIPRHSKNYNTEQTDVL
jgi:hypothetical protein